ncbi:NUDIX domain-containing protein [Proteiniborus ethanoligenes]|uniref:NUDIX domain-containing protein n=1 Tax=Proteiniborus ethanoligenes TaxID=415015 RepID=A0A1H3R728_9FIRM|nr:NUDIX hydrolase [Proteiniborus ethanoligenes]SDZ21460.1 NUDIX domain-containing protein [Proteiniborus ethanoligenes]
MRQEISAGGVVVFGNAILLLRKYNGDWVLPKGKVEDNEDIAEAATREVLEEGGVKANIVKYLGKINYTFRNTRDEEEIVNKTVHWFLMETRNMDCVPQKQEGFVDAVFVHVNRAAEIAKYEDEKKIILKAIQNM